MLHIQLSFNPSEGSADYLQSVTNGRSRSVNGPDCLGEYFNVNPENTHPGSACGSG